MAVDHLLPSFILLLISNTGFSADDTVFVQTGDSVQLDIQTHELPFLYWDKDNSRKIVTYISQIKEAVYDTSYKKRVNFNTETFSLTLKNMQKTDSGLYRARAIGDNAYVAAYRVSVIDAVEDPVLTVNSNWSSSDSCTVNFTCGAHDLMIHSSYQNNRCSSEEVTSHEIYTLILYCSEESIICNHSNPVSSKTDKIEIKQLCGENEILLIPLYYSSSYKYVLIIVFGVVGVIVFGGLVLYCCCKNNKGVKQSDDSDYDDVETLRQKMTGDTWTTVSYCAVGHQTPSSAHDC
ncbi:CD48 antigen [Anabarilius grahami]|uniref:CD48 antigen n=1 Tax=Anabarilius grahami TaxID=495550 RepID=A0A3N0YCT9_ANAGA|nr:CD48 antigen [Anabarilius grahami]